MGSGKRVSVEINIVSKHNDKYYIVFDYFDDDTLYLTPLQKSADRDYAFYRLDENDEPLFFENSYKEKDKSNGYVRPILDAHMSMTDVILSNPLREKIKEFDIAGTQFYPSVIIDDNDKYHEGYWLINIYERLDCLDYDKCTIKRYVPGSDSHKVKKYFLSETVLDMIPGEQRLIFRPDNTDMDYTFFHEKIVNILKKFDTHTLPFFKVSEWEAGMQFE